MTSRSLSTLACAGLVFLSTSIAHADVRLPALFSEHMVLQRDANAPVWGWAEPGEQVSVTLADQSQTAQADAKGKWLVKLANLKAGGPHTLTVKGKNTVTVEDVLIGEVWLGSGQSNMAMSVSRAKNFAAEQAAAKLPQIRMFTVSSLPSDTPQDDCAGSWSVCTPETVGRFSATLFFFGREIHKTVQVPVGLINSSVGGTPIESWVSAEAQYASAELKPLIDSIKAEQDKFDPVAAQAKFDKDLARWKERAQQAKAEGKTAPVAPRNPVATRKVKGNIGGLFNGKIAPLVPYGIRGVVWYQGEANTNDTKSPYYRYHLPLLVNDWRARWGSELPLAWVQLPNYNRNDGWCVVREAMLKTLRLPKTGMAITIDVGDPKDIHPANKQDVGKRLAMWALGTVYGEKVATSGPLPGETVFRDRDAVTTFTHTDGGLQALGGGELKGFVIAGDDKQWKPAKARIEGNTVIVSHPDGVKPTAVRYAWQGNPECNLYNGAGLPASPFRTDDAK